MKKIIEEMLRHRIIILIISVLLIVSGIYSYINIPKEEMPKIETIYGYVQIVAPGLNNQEIADKISSPIEDIINDYSNVESFKTTSIDNASIILIEMGIGDTTSAETLEKIKTDVLNANIDERISSIDFITNMKTGEVIYAVHSESLSEMQLMQIADDLAKHLQGVENISRAKLNTAYSEEIVVTVDYDMLNSMPITLLDVFNVIMANGMELPLGNASFDDKSASILIDANYTTTGEIQDLVLFSDGETTYLISDIAKVVKKNTKNKKVYEFNGEITAFVEVFFDEDIDYTVLGDEIEDAVKEFTDTQTEEVSITSMTFSPKYVSEQVNSVMKNLLLCIAIVMLVVLIGLGFRNAIAIAITIPVIVMATIGVLYIMGNHLQLMSIAGLIVSIGILVDNSIVISEAVQHELNIGRDIKTACVNAIKDNYLPVLTSTLTTVAAFIPLMYLPGVAGDVAFTLPLTILIAISLSYVIAMTLTPTLAKMFFKRKKYKKKKIMKFNKKIRRSMKSIFKLSLAPTIIAFLVLGVLSYLVVMRLEIDILPKTEKSIVYIDYEYNEINDDTGTYDFAKDIEVIVKDQDNVISYAFSQGGDLPKFYMTLDVVNNLPHNGRFFIEFDCKAIELEGYMKNLEDDLQESGNIVVNRLELAQPSAPVQILLLSNEYENLESVSMDIYSEVEKLDSFKTGELIAPKYKKDLVLKIDKSKANMNGLTVAEIEQQIAYTVNGLSEALFNDNENILDVKVSTDIKSRTDLLDLNIKTSMGTVVPLREIATLRVANNLEYSKTFNGRPSITIDAYMEDGYSTYALEKDIKEIIDAHIDNSIDVVYKGDNELTNEVFSGLIIAFAIALFVIYMIMYVQFKSLKQPLIILVAIPLSFIGSLAMMLALGEKITLTSLLGVMSLVGIVVNNGILLVEYINRHHENGHSIYDSCIKAVERRLRPIALSSLTTIFGLIPLALYGGDFFRPMAVTFIGGMLTSALLVLLIIPSLYYFTYKKQDLRKMQPPIQ